MGATAGPVTSRRVSPDEMIAAAIQVAGDGLAAGELPIGAVVVMGDDIVGRTFTREKAEGRRLVHADLLAMTEADRSLGWTQRPAPLGRNAGRCLTARTAIWPLIVRSGVWATDLSSSHHFW